MLIDNQLRTEIRRLAINCKMRRIELLRMLQSNGYCPVSQELFIAAVDTLIAERVGLLECYGEN